MPGRRPQVLEKVPLMVKGKLAVKNEVVAQKKEKVAGICLSEMQQVFLCYKRFSFSEEACAKEITNFKACFNKTRNLFNEEPETKGKISREEITKLLKRFPERKKERF